MDHSTILALIGMTLAIIGLLLSLRNMKRNRRIKDRKHYPHTIHEVINSQWPGELQEVNVEYENGEENEFIARSDNNGLFITNTKFTNEDDIPFDINYRTIEELSDEKIAVVGINFYYEIQVAEEMKRINDSR